jgi:hypothetical protein
MKDVEDQKVDETNKSTSTSKQSAFRWLDRFLAIWILLAMAM